LKFDSDGLSLVFPLYLRLTDGGSTYGKTFGILFLLMVYFLVAVCLSLTEDLVAAYQLCMQSVQSSGKRHR
jgi:hypothetical protein